MLLYARVRSPWFRQLLSIVSKNKDEGFENKYCWTANIIIPRISPPRRQVSPVRELILAEEEIRCSLDKETKRKLRNNNPVSMDRLRMSTNSRRSSVVALLSVSTMYIYIYIYMLVRLDDYCKTVKLLQFSWSPSNTCCRLLTGQIDRCENSPF